jgi:hypothetical protein
MSSVNPRRIEGGADDRGTGQRDLDHTQVHNLAAAATELPVLKRAAAVPVGRAALTLVSGAGALKQTLLAFRGACALPSTTLRCSDASGPARPDVAGGERASIEPWGCDFTYVQKVVMPAGDKADPGSSGSMARPGLGVRGCGLGRDHALSAR